MSGSVFRPFIRSALLRLRIAQTKAGSYLKPILARPYYRLLGCRSVALSGELCKRGPRFDQPHLRYYRAATVRKMPESKKFERLPKDVVPTNYKLRLQPDLTAFTFAGSEEIDVEVSSENPKLFFLETGSEAFSLLKKKKKKSQLDLQMSF